MSSSSPPQHRPSSSTSSASSAGKKKRRKNHKKKNSGTLSQSQPQPQNPPQSQRNVEEKQAEKRVEKQEEKRPAASPPQNGSAQVTAPELSSHPAISVESGKFNSTNIRILDPDAATPEALLRVLDDAEAKNNKGAIFVNMPVKDMHKFHDVCFNTKKLELRQIFAANTQPDDQPRAEYYRWCNPNEPDAVPPAATYISGVGVCIVDKDGNYLLAKEGERFKGRYKMVSGGVDLGETVVEAARREIKEELGIDADRLDFDNSRVLGGYIQSGARPGLIGDFYLFISCTMRTDPLPEYKLHEVTELKWFSPDEVRNIVADCKANESRFLKDVLRAMASHVHGQGFPLVQVEKGKLDRLGREIGNKFWFFPE